MTATVQGAKEHYSSGRGKGKAGRGQWLVMTERVTLVTTAL